MTAENTERKWIGIDVSAKAYELVQLRLNKEVARPDALEPWRNEVHFDTRVPRRTDLGKTTESQNTSTLFQIRNMLTSTKWELLKTSISD